MSRGLFIQLLLGLILSFRTEAFEFTIARNLNDTEAVGKEFWSYVEITENEENIMTVNVDIPTSFYTSVKIFFANDVKQILEVELAEPEVRGKFYGTPYRLEKTMKGSSTTRWPIRVGGQFPASWLPEKCSKVSASVAVTNGEVYNYYGLKNFKISLPDLMVVEEYKNYRRGL